MITDERMREFGEQLQATLYEEIPITQQLQVAVGSYDGASLMLHAPLAANINHKGTLFAGSLNAVATLTGWGLTWLLLEEEGLQAEIVIQDSTIAYRLPVTNDFAATCCKPDAEQVARFIASLRQRGRARISLTARIVEDGREAVTFQGRYVAHFEPTSPTRGDEHL